MTVEVDETGNDELSLGIDDASGSRPIETPDRDHPVAANPEVSEEPGVAASVDDPARLDQHVIWTCLGAAGGLSERRTSHQRQNQAGDRQKAA